jgi:hypothetical protein
MKSIYNLGLHEVTESDNYIIKRVPGGWLYVRKDPHLGSALPMVFVPFNNEFSGDRDNEILKGGINMKLEDAFRGLREKWFIYHLQRHAQERVNESEEDEKYREEDNNKTKIKYDEQTESIIKGVNKPLAPTCEFDMDRGY